MARLYWFLAYFLAALLPRLSPLLSGVVFADDLIHRPYGHLLSYRVLNFLELGLWEFVFGRDYLLGPIPKILGALYTAGLCSAIRYALRSWSGKRSVAFSIMALLIPLHPLWNTFLCWNVTAVYVLSLLLITLGYIALEKRPALGIATILLGISGYQVHAGLLAPLLFAEYACRREAMPLRRRVLQSASAVAIYLAIAQVVALAGFHTWGDRGLGMPIAWRPVTKNLAVIAQPLLSYYVSLEAAWRYWPLLFVLLGLLCLTARPRTFALAPIILPTAAAAVVLGIKYAPTGPRLAAAIWIATLLAVVHSRTALAAMVVFAILAIPPMLIDAENRTRGWRADRALLAQLAPGEPVAIVRSGREPVIPPEWRTRPVVMEHYEPATPFTYANGSVHPEWLLPRFEHPIVEARPGVRVLDRSTMQLGPKLDPRGQQ